MWNKVNPRMLTENLIRSISEEWMLITAGSEKGYNMMTASWGLTGEMWGSDAVMAVVRPQRYTLGFLENNDYFTLSFYGDNKEIHKICGNKSGRDTDKTALCGLHPVFKDNSVFFEEARMVLICKKQYIQQMRADCFTDPEPLHWYPSNDFHYMIIGRIESVLVKE